MSSDAIVSLHGIILIVGGVIVWVLFCFFFQAEDGIRDLVRSRGLGDVYKRQASGPTSVCQPNTVTLNASAGSSWLWSNGATTQSITCLLYTSDAADERSSVDLGGRRIIKKKNTTEHRDNRALQKQ